MRTTKTLVSEQRQRREARRLISHALAGIALSAGLLAVPTTAATVSNTNDSGAGSLRSAVTAADGTVDFSGLGSTTVNLLSALPNITGSTAFDLDDSQVVIINDASAFSITDGITLTGNHTIVEDPRSLQFIGSTSITNSTVGGTITIDNLFVGLNGGIGATGAEGGQGEQGGAGQTGGTNPGSAGAIGDPDGGVGATGSTASFTSNLILNNASEIDLTGGAGGAGGQGGRGGTGGTGGTGGDGSPAGQNGTPGTAGGTGGEGGPGGTGQSGGTGGAAKIIGDVAVNDTSILKLIGGNGSGVSGDGGPGGTGGTGGNGGDTYHNGNTNKTAAGGDGGTGGTGAVGGTGGIGGDGGNVSVVGNVTASGSSQVLLQGGHGGTAEGSGSDGTGGTGGVGGDAGAGTEPGAGGVGGAGGAGGDGGNVDAGNGGDSLIQGDIIANQGSTFTLTAGDNNDGLGGDAYIDGTATANGTNSITHGTITLNGNNGDSGDTYITGDATANNYGEFYLHNGSHIGTNVDPSIAVLAENSGKIYLDSGSYIGDPNSLATTNATSNGEYHLDDSAINGTAEAGGGGSYTLTNGSNISGNATANAGGLINLIDSSIGSSLNLVTTTADGGSFMLDPSTIYGDSIALNGGTYDLDESGVTGDATINGSGTFTLINESYIGTDGNGNTATANGGLFSLNDSTIYGDAIANNSGSFSLSNGSLIDGNATFNATSTLEVKGLNTIDGDLAFATGATFLPHLDTSDVTDPSILNTLTVTGQLTPGGATIKPILDNFVNVSQIAPLQEYRVLTFDTRDGDFNSIVNSILPFEIEYDGNNVDLIFTPDETSPQGGFDITNLPGTLNERTLGAYLNNLISYNPDTQIYTINQSGTQLPWYDGTASFADILTAISNDGDLTQIQDSELIADSYTSYYAQTYWNQKAFIDTIADQLRNGNDTQDVAADFALNPNSASSISNRLNSLRRIMDVPAHGLGYTNGNRNSSGIWASVSGRSLSTDRDDYIGSPNWHSSSLAYTVGYTGAGDSFNWGVAVGHQKNDLTFYDRNASGEMEGYNAGLYAGWHHKKSYLNAILGYGSYNADAITHSGSGSSSFKTKGLSAALEIGKHLSGDKDSGFTPYASLMWVRSKNGNINESYGGSGVAFKSGSQNTLTSQLGVRYLHTMIDKNGQKKGGWRAGLSWLHNFGNNDFAMEGSYPILDLPFTFTERNTPLFSNALQMELGAYGRIHNSLVGFVGYRGVFSSEQKQHGVTAGIEYQF